MNSNFILCDWQYESVRKLTLNDFYVGQVVFITCAPERPLIVTNILNNEVTFQGVESGKINTVPFTAILPYKYAGLMVYKGRFKVCLN